MSEEMNVVSEVEMSPVAEAVKTSIPVVRKPYRPLIEVPEMDEDGVVKIGPDGQPMVKKVRALDYVRGKKFYGISCICGGGKTVLLKDLLLEQYHPDNPESKGRGITLVASKTLELSSQTFKDFEELCEESGVKIKAYMMDSRTDSNVRGSVMELVGDEETEAEDAILFISHATLFNLMPVVWQQCHVYCDEIPADLVKYVELNVKDTEATKFLMDNENGWAYYEPTNHKDQQALILKYSKLYNAKEELQHAWAGATNQNTKALDIIQMLVDGFDPVYVRTTTEKVEKNADEWEYEDYSEDENLQEQTGTGVVYEKKAIGEMELVNHVFQGIYTKNLFNMLAYPKTFTILAANIVDTLAGYIAMKRFQANLVMLHQDRLPQKHKYPITIIPFLKEGNYSSGMKNSKAQESIVGSNYNGTVFQLYCQFAYQTLQGKEFLFFKNNKDQVPPPFKANSSIMVRGTQVHGMNNMTDFTKGAFAGSLYPTPFYCRALEMYARDTGLNPKEIIEMTKKERSKEAAYQCIARMNFRLDSLEDKIASGDHVPTKCVAIVPDKSYVEYMRQFWEPEAFQVMDKLGHEAVSRKGLDVAKENRWNLLRAALEIQAAQKSAPKGQKMKIGEILQSVGIKNNQTFCNYKNEFEDRMELELGIKRKIKKPKEVNEFNTPELA